MKGLVLLDWDNTIVDEQVQINDPDFRKVIREKIEQGWQVGLNSDTPLTRLQGWWKSLNMNGPIVAEKGAVIWWEGSQAITLSKASAVFSAFRKEIVDLVTQKEKHALFFGDSTEFIRSVNHISSNDLVLIALDAYRVCSLGLFVRLIKEGQLLCDVSAAKEIYELVKSIRPSHPLVSEIDFNIEHCFLGVNSLDVEKATGVRALLEKWARPPAVFMIGDSFADYMNLPEVRHLAVGNAKPDYKKIAERTAQKNFAQGCVELLATL